VCAHKELSSIAAAEIEGGWEDAMWAPGCLPQPRFPWGHPAFQREHGSEKTQSHLPTDLV
jgi:hypothetical protein